MKKKILEIATKKHIFEKLSMGWKIVLVCILLLPIALLSLSSIMIQSSIKGVYEGQSLIVQSDYLEAKIVVDEPQYFKDFVNQSGYSVTRGLAPFPVFFEGWQSLPAEEIAEYTWDFGDSANSTIENPNTSSGFNAAHVYEKPGIYRASLTVKNRSGLTNTAYINIEVVERNGITYYVDYDMSKCSDDNDGKSKEEPWCTADRVFKKMASTTSYYGRGDSVLFRSGGTYEFTTTTVQSKQINELLFSKYDLGPKPIIKFTGQLRGNEIIKGLRFNSSGIAFVDLQFELKNPANNLRAYGILGGSDKIKNILFLRVDAYDAGGSFLAFSASDDGKAKEAVTTGVFVVGSTFQLRDYDPALNGNALFYGWMGRMALINSIIDKSMNHLTYFSHLNKGLITGNILSRPAMGRQAFRIDGNLTNGKGSNYVYAANNRIMGWRDPLVGGAHQVNSNTYKYNNTLAILAPNTEALQSIQNILFEKNIIINTQRCLEIGDAENITISSNLCVSPNNDSNTTNGIVIGHAFEKAPSKNIKIVGNTFVGVTPNGIVPFIRIDPYRYFSSTSLQHSNIKILNNIFYRIEGGGGKAIRLGTMNPSLLSNLTINGNLYYFPGQTDGKIFSIATSTTVVNYNFSEWQALGYGYDADSYFGLKPLFQKSLAFATNGTGEPLTLDVNLGQANNYLEMLKLINDPVNPAIDKGLILSYLYNDFYGNKRADGSWNGSGHFDIGAYEVAKTPNIPPTANFSLNTSSNIAPATFNFDARLSSDQDGSISNYTWNFGDGSVGNGATINHIFDTAGTYQVKLTVTDNNGSTADKTESVIVLSKDTIAPVTTASPLGGSYTEPINITLSSNEPASIYACIGTGCSPVLIGSDRVQLIIDKTSDLNYYSIDSSNNTEATKKQTYAINIPCNPSWDNCTPWSECNGGIQTRICSDTNKCSPDTEQSQSCSLQRSNGGNGLKASYFSNNNLNNAPVLVRIDPIVNFIWSKSSPDPIIPINYFSVRWEGQVQIDNAGEHTFYTRTDDGAKLWVDGQLLIDKWVGQPLTTWSGKIYLSEGKHNLKMEYFESSADASAMLYWSGPGFATEIIPQGSLYTDYLGSCTEKWVCSWGACVGGYMTKKCVDQNNCGTTANKPNEAVKKCK